MALSVVVQQSTFLLLLLLQMGAPHGAAMLVHSSPMKSRKSLAHDTMYTAATHATLPRLAHDVTDFVKMAVHMAVFS